MTHGEQLVLDDANEFVRQATEQLEEQDTSTGLRPHPVIETTETVLETARFGMGFAPKPLAEALPAAGGGPPPTGICPRNTTICVTFSNLEVCCNHLLGGGPFIETVDISINGSFTLTRTVNLIDFVQWEGTGGDVHFNQYPNSRGGCTGTPDQSCNVINLSKIAVQCFRDAGGVLRHNINYGIEYFDVCVTGWDSVEAQIFRLYQAAGVLEFGVTENTEIGCGETGTGRGIAFDGVVSVEEGSC